MESIKRLGNFFRKRRNVPSEEQVENELDLNPDLSVPKMEERLEIPLEISKTQILTHEVESSDQDLDTPYSQDSDINTENITNTSNKETEAIPADHFIVIADDESIFRQAISNEVDVFYSDQNRKDFSYRFEMVKSFEELLKQALTGNAGLPADVLLLDDNYSVERNKWKPDIAQIEYFAKQKGIDFSPYIPKKNKMNRIYESTIQDFLIEYPDSTNFSIILRALGYSGQIIVVSSAPPLASGIVHNQEEIRKVAPSHPSEFPINGIVHLSKREWVVNSWATSIAKSSNDNEKIHYRWDAGDSLFSQGKFSLAEVLEKIIPLPPASDRSQEIL